MPPPSAILRVLVRALLVVALLALVSTLVINLWMRAAAKDAIHLVPGETPARPFAIVPGASVHGDGTPSGALEGRLTAALKLYGSGRVERILVSGLDAGPSYDEVGGMRAWLGARGVDPDDLESDEGGLRTLDTMERAARRYGVDGAVICTQRYHLPRALFLARHAGIDAVGLVADPERARAGWREEAREYLARIRAFLDVYLLGTQPELGA